VTPRSGRRSDMSAALGGLLILPALLFMTASVLKYELGVPFLYDGVEPLLGRLDSPVVLLGGLLSAAVINILAVVRLDCRREAERLVGTIAIETRGFNLIVLGISALLLGGLLGYLFLENFAPR